MKIILATSGQPALNPRLVKEADALAAAGHEVTVFYAYWNDWGTRFDDHLLPRKRWQAFCMGGNPKSSKLVFNLSRIIYRASKLIFKHLPAAGADYAIARSSYFLKRSIKKHRADLYIAHNLGALPAVVEAAKFHQKRCGFDAEDFHRNEATDDHTSVDFKLKTYLEDKYLTQVDYITASSPQIARLYKQLYQINPVEVLLNVFPKADFQLPMPAGRAPVKLFWTSQTIGAGRGLETVMQALTNFNTGEFELHLLGYASEKTKIRFGHAAIFHEPVPPEEMIAFAAQFDIGLATELGQPFNREVCLTNKLFIYIQAGLAIIASDTTAQSELLQLHAAGRLFKRDDCYSLVQTLQSFLDDRKLLNAIKIKNYRLGQQRLNWEEESTKFLQLIDRFE